MLREVTCSAPVNIAVIKYWGKRNEKLILPINSSLSVTLNQDDLCSKTSVQISPDFGEDELYINGEKQDITSARFQACLKGVRQLTGDLVDSNGTVPSSKLKTYKAHIRSINNFPTAAGLASSAAGFACLTYSLGKAYCVNDPNNVKLSSIARQGSGSACRSLNGGFVRWNMGVLDDGSDSNAEEVFPESHWPDLDIVVLVAGAHKKKVGSTPGMRRSLETSHLLKVRSEHIVPKRIVEIEEAIKRKNFAQFAKLTIMDSNNMHATCLDTYPPLHYMNDVSYAVQNMIHEFNKDGEKVAYTFDAGPNAVLIMPKVGKEHTSDILRLVLQLFPPTSFSKFFATPNAEKRTLEACPNLNTPEIADRYKTLPIRPNGLSSIFVTSIGDGPRELGPEHSVFHKANL